MVGSYPLSFHNSNCTIFSQTVGINRDYQKLALAQMQGWRCFLLSSDMVNFEWVQQLGEFCRMG
jgi:hypothetical protein